MDKIYYQLTEDLKPSQILSNNQLLVQYCKFQGILGRILFMLPSSSAFMNAKLSKTKPLIVSTWIHFYLVSLLALFFAIFHLYVTTEVRFNIKCLPAFVVQLIIIMCWYLSLFSCPLLEYIETILKTFISIDQPSVYLIFLYDIV